MKASCDIIRSWQFVSDLAGSGQEVYLEPERPFVGDSLDADEEIDRRIERFEKVTGLNLLGVCLKVLEFRMIDKGGRDERH